MEFKKMMTLALACLMLAAALAGCGRKKPIATLPNGETAPVLDVPETEDPGHESTEGPAHPTEMTEQPTTEPAKEPIDRPEPTEAPKPTEAPWVEDPVEDTRPPIEVTVPQETQPYTDYERYMDMSAEEQEAFFNSFENEQAFFDWFNQARTEYEQAHPPVIIDGSTNIELTPPD